MPRWRMSSPTRHTVRTREEQIEAGLDARERIPPASLGELAGYAGRTDPVDLLADQSADRIAGQPEVVFDADLGGVLHLRR